MKCSWLKDTISYEIYHNSFKDGTNEINDKIVSMGGQSAVVVSIKNV